MADELIVKMLAASDSAIAFTITNLLIEKGVLTKQEVSEAFQASANGARTVEGGAGVAHILEMISARYRDPAASS